MCIMYADKDCFTESQGNYGFIAFEDYSMLFSLVMSNSPVRFCLSWLSFFEDDNSVYMCISKINMVAVS